MRQGHASFFPFQGQDTAVNRKSDVIRTASGPPSVCTERLGTRATKQPSRHRMLPWFLSGLAWALVMAQMGRLHCQTIRSQARLGALSRDVQKSSKIRSPEFHQICKNI